MPLSDAKVRSLKPREKTYKVSDAEGLYMEVKPNGTRLWRLAYRYGGKQKALSFGVYPTVPLLEARRLRDEAKRTLATGMDPAFVRREEKLASQQDGTSFKEVAERWMEVNASQWVSAYAVRLKNRMNQDVYPTLGHRPIPEIKPREILAVIRKIEKRGAIETARRIYQMIGSVFRFAVGEGIIDSDPSRDINSSLAPKQPSKKRSALREDQIPEYLARVDAYQGEAVTRYSLRFILHTFVRTSELRWATWDEFEGLDGSTPLWRIPAERMKLRREHLVPITPQSLGILRDLQMLNGDSGWVFPSPRTNTGVISENTMIYAMYKMGYHSKATIHGLRSTASTVLNEREFNRDVVELQLAHVDASVRGIYNSALWLKQRRQMMVWWSDFVEPPAELDDLFEGL